MFLTVTPNTALDRVIYIDEFTPGGVMRPQKVVNSVGGKGLDASVVLRAFDLPTLGVGFIAGDTGRALMRLLDRYGIQHDLVEVEGDTRIAHVIVETRHHRHSHITIPGYRVCEEDVAVFFQKLADHLPGARALIAGGTLPGGLPADFYARVAREARAFSVPVIVDTSGEPARLAAGARPFILKLNENEFADTFQTPVTDMDGLVEQARQIFRQYQLHNLVITCGSRGILALTGAETWLATSPRQVAVNAAGAGDAVSAVLAWRLAEGDVWNQALRWAAAASAAVVLTEGTADCRRADAEHIFPLVEVKAL